MLKDAFQFGICRGSANENEKYICEQKFNGARYAFVWNNDKVKIVSRHVSVDTGDYVDKTDNVPHISNSNYKFNGLTILDGEMILDEYKTSYDVMTIMGSDSERAVKLQEEKGKIKFKVFDVLFYNNVDYRNRSIEERKEILRKIIREMNNEYIQFVDYIIGGKEEIDAMFNTIVQKGGEGLVLKVLGSKYGDPNAWIKVKRVATYDVVIMGYTKTSSQKYKDKGWIRSVQIGLYDKEGKLVHFGNVSGMCEKVRDFISKNKEQLIGKVIEIKAQQTYAGISFINPRFVRFRPDKNANECTIELQVNNK
jgi:bifunctional non-homologous end joining protein LigD